MRGSTGNTREHCALLNVRFRARLCKNVILFLSADSGLASYREGLKRVVLRRIVFGDVPSETPRQLPEALLLSLVNG